MRIKPSLLFFCFSLAAVHATAAGFHYGIEGSTRMNVLSSSDQRTQQNAVAGEVAYELSKTLSLSGGFITAFSSQGGEIIESQGPANQFDIYMGLQHRKDIIRDLKWINEGGMTLPLGEENQYQQVRGVFSAATTLRYVYFDERCVLVNKFEGELMANTFDRSPTTLKWNSDRSFAYSLANQFIFTDWLFSGIGAGIRSSHFLDESDSLSTKGFLFIGAKLQSVTAKLTYINGNYIDQEHAAPWVLDQYRQLIELKVGVEF